MRPSDFGITNHEGEELWRRTTFGRRRFWFLSEEKKTRAPVPDRSTDKPLSYNDDLPGLMAQPFSVSNPPQSPDPDGTDSSDDDGRGHAVPHTHAHVEQ